MTEADWWAADDPIALPEWLFHHARADERKLRLFCLDCCRAVAREHPNWGRARLIEPLTDWVDGRIDQAALSDHLGPVDEYLLFPVPGEHLFFDPGPHFSLDALLVEAARGEPVRGEHTRGMAAYPTAVMCGTVAHLDGPDIIPRMRTRVRVLHDLFGPLPFRDIVIDPDWRTSTVIALANGIYEDRAFHLLPVLADALDDAGCDQPDILDHCRRPDWEHVRGCWVVDLLLGRPWREPGLGERGA